MKRSIHSGFNAGVAAGALVATVDCLFIIAGTGSFWPRPSGILAAFGVYGSIGGAAGAIIGTVWKKSRTEKKNAPGEEISEQAFLLTFVGLLVFSCIHMFDVALVESDRGRFMPYLIAVPIAGCGAIGVFGLLRILFFLLGGRYRAGLVVSLFGAGLLAGVFTTQYAFSTSSEAGAAAPAAGTDRPNVVLFVLDTTRRDALSCFGNRRNTTPNLDRIVSESLVFNNAYATASWTPPSHASMFTGCYPSKHGTFSNQVKLTEDFPTLAEEFGNAGYETFFIASKGLLLKIHGWDRGFENAVVVNVENKVSTVYNRLIDKFIRDESPTSSTISVILRWLETRDDTRPYFLFVNISDSHTPYRMRSEFVKKWCSEIDMSGVDEKKMLAVGRFKGNLERYNRNEFALEPEEIEYLRCLYDGEARFLDHHVGRLFDGLRKPGPSGRSTITLVTADHGELFGEHGLLSHGHFLYNELLNVPFILWGLERRGEVDTPISLVDIFPTLLNAAGISDRRDSDIDGRDILDPGVISEPRKLYAETWTRGGARKAVYAENYKYLWDSGREPQFFDLMMDPGELVDLSAEVQSKTAEFHSDLADNFDLAMAGISASEVGVRTAEILQSLGYVQ